STVFQCFGFADACTGDLLPLHLALPGEPGRVFEVPRGWEAAGGELDDAAGAVNAQPESRRGAVLRLVGAERAQHALIKAVGGVDVIADDGAHPFTPLADVGF